MKIKMFKMKIFTFLCYINIRGDNMNSFNDTLSFYMMPLLEVVALCLLIIFLFYLIKLVISLNETVLKTHNTINLVDKSIEKIQDPLNTVSRVSKSVDKASDTVSNMFKGAKDAIVESAGKIRNKFKKNDDGEYFDDEDDE